MPDPALSIAELPRALPAPARARPRRWPSPIWLVPALAAVLGTWLAVRGLNGRGPLVTITFATAEGLVAKLTTVRYKSVDIGVVEAIDLLPDRSGVAVSARLSAEAEDLLREGARFWVVRPRVSPAGISGMGTLIAGACLGLEAGTGARPARHFVGLEQPPFVAERPGRRYLLRGASLGSLEVGSPVYLRRLKVGQTTAVSLDEQARGVVEVFIEAPYHRHVTSNARFWHASGVDLSVSARGLKLDTQSLAAVLLGGIAFEAPQGPAANASNDPPAAEGREFILSDTREAAMRNPSGLEERFALRFPGAVRGLAAGATVELLGQPIGEVEAVDLAIDPSDGAAITTAVLSVAPYHFRGGTRPFLDQAVARGLRARLRSDNPLTSQRYVSLELVSTSSRAAVDWSVVPPRLPAVAADDRDLLAEVRRTFAGTSRLVTRLDRKVVPQLGALLGQANQTMSTLQQSLSSEGVLQHEARGAMRDVSNAAQAMRSLSEYLERHPESLIRGKRADRR